MKFHSIILLAALAVLASCEKDNYEAPGSTLQGRIVYNGEPINVEYNQVRFQLWEPGWGKLAPIDVPIEPDGSYSALLFDGNYKLVFPGGQGPFMTLPGDGAGNDTIYVELRGSRNMDIEVMPWYMVRNTEFSLSGNTLTATCSLEQVVTGDEAREVERVSLYINKTQFVSGASNLRSADLSGADIASLDNISLSAEVPEIIPAQDYVFARIGVKIAGVEDMIFSAVQKVQF